MSDEPLQNPDDDPDSSESSSTPGPSSQEIRHAHVSALVPEKVGRGVFSTGAVVLQGSHEFVIDFLLRMTSPHQVAARVVLPPDVVGRFIGALRENLGNYRRNFGSLPQGPQIKPPAAAPQQGSVQDLYEQLKIPEDVVSGRYANAVMIGHTATEFSFDFITTFFPRSAVACRVYLSAPNVPKFLDSLSHSFEQYQRRLRGQPPAPDEPPPEPQ